LYLTQSDANEVAVSANTEEARNKIITEVEGGTLIIRTEKNDSWFNWKNWRNTNAKAYVSVKELDALTASGATNVKLLNKIESPKLKVRLSGASDFKGELTVGTLNLEASGASDFRGKIHAKSLILDASGASSAKLFELNAKGGIVHASGASTANVNASQLLKLDAAGASNINYKGDAVVKESKNSGASNIRHKD
jgi:hypothetical protein